MTAEALESMTDAGKFEQLAMPILRELYAPCKTLAHLGVNEAGKTIPNPVDAFCLVPGSDPPQYVMAAFTTVSVKKLREKWLLDAGTAGVKTKEKSARPDGDLIKAAKKAAVIRQSEPSAEFILYLCTNRRLNVQLMQEVYAKGREFGIEVCFPEQSQLSEFLNTKPTGQWLRQRYLGIDADQLSRTLLQHLGIQSLDAYARERMLLAEIDEIVPTIAASSASDAIRGSFSSLHLLVGPSGAGKTVIAQDVLRRHLKSGGLGLWIPNEVADRAASLSEAIRETLGALHPRIAKVAGHEALELATIDDPLLLIVDDVNRSPQSATTLSKIMGWCRSLQRGDASGAQRRSSVRVMCPLWDVYWHPIRETFGGAPWLHVQVVGALRRAEAVACLKASLGQAATRFSQPELEDFAEHLRDDPILLSLFGRQLRSGAESNPKALSQDVIGSFVRSVLSEVSSKTHIPSADYVLALTSLAHEMIRRRSLYPPWVELCSWFSGIQSTIDAIRHVTAEQHVCRIATQEQVERFEFRHDRILEYYLCLAAAELLAGTDTARELVSDPFFVPIVGRAVARIHASDSVLEWVTKRAPVALIASIPYLSATEAKNVIDRAHGWLRDWPSALAAVQEDAFDTLVAIQSTHVLNVTRDIPGNKAVWQARLRNGDADAGSNALAVDFFPRVSYPWLESLIEEAKFFHTDKLALQLEKMLVSGTLDGPRLRGALTLAGYIGDSRLARSVKIAWDNASERGEVLVAALWAAVRCAGDKPSDLLDSILPAIFEVSNEGPTNLPTDRDRVLQDLGFALRHGTGEPVLRYLVALGSTKDEYTRVVTALLEKVDHPIAIGYVVRKIAQTAEEAKQAGAFSPFAMMWADQWRPRRADQESRSLSAASTDELQSFWTNESEPEWLRTFAFSVWARFVPDLQAARLVLEKAPKGDGTVWHRALRGDTETVPDVIIRLGVDSHWLHVVPRIWCAELQSGVEAWLARVEECKPGEDFQGNLHYELAQCLRDIPIADSLRLLLKHWSRVRFAPLFIQLALYLGSEETRSLAKESLQAGASEKAVFRFIDSFFGFRTEGLSDRLGQSHLESLRPYLNHLAALAIDEMITHCHAYGYWDWALVHLRTECMRRIDANSEGDEQQRIVSVTRRWFPTDQDLLAEFDRLENAELSRLAGSVWVWLERLSGRDIRPDRLFTLLEQWVNASPTVARFRVAAAILRNRGQRTALKILRSKHDKTLASTVDLIVLNAEYKVKRRSLD